MTQDLAHLVSVVNAAQRRLRETPPRTIEWRYAQHEAMHARADYWDAMCLEWDRHHPRTAHSS